MGEYSAGKVVVRSIAISVLKVVLEDGLNRLRRRAEVHMHRNCPAHQLLLESIRHVNFVLFAVARAEWRYNRHE